MPILFLLIIYMTFVSLGLPDSLLGNAWPVMSKDFGMPLSAAGLPAIVTSVCGISASILSVKIIKRFGTGKVTFFSTLLTVIALLGISTADSFLVAVLFSIPAGFGSGAIDAGLNNYVALHYKAHHMSWLHCFWGVGATLGPIIMSGYLKTDGNWQGGYFTVGAIQLSLAFMLLVTLPLWRKMNVDTPMGGHHEDLPDIAEAHPLKIKGVPLALLTFVSYCGVEASMGLWGSSFLVNTKGFSPATAASVVSLFYAGLTIGRLLSGFMTMKFSNRTMIRLGQSILLLGILDIAFMPSGFMLVGFVLAGLGCAPIYPSMLHETPRSFGAVNSQAVIGYQVAFGALGATTLPPIVGVFYQHIGIGYFPAFTLVFALLMLFASQKLLSSKGGH